MITPEAILSADVPPILATEMAAQMNAGTGNALRLMGLGMPAVAATEFAQEISSGSYTFGNLLGLGFSPELAALLSGSGVADLTALFDSFLMRDDLRMTANG